MARSREAFGERVPGLETFAAALESEGVRRGLIGPREVPRLWGRHILNSAAVTPHLPSSGTVIDVGSGAGLPGVVVGCLRPDLDVVLLEPMERRAAWLSEVCALLELPGLRVVRGRAEEMHGRLAGDAVVARAVAPLERLARWTLPLARVGGVLLALKGSSADAEVAEAAAVIQRLGGAPAEVLHASALPGVEETTLVRVRVVRSPAAAQQRSRRPRSSR